MATADSSGTDRNGSATVLLVEDDRPLLEFFSTVLRREGYNVLTAENGPEALEIAKNRPGQRIDILLSDVSMPYMGGIQLAESLWETRPDIRVLLTSGLPAEEV
ncbi:MAG: response regulator, partial [Chloroflexi bacterium]|nr:response regulator [Chloroflexota bacterium]